MQSVLRSETENLTVICISHRLRTIGDFDQILVLNNGTLAETGTPRELLEMDKLYADLCRQSGEYNHLCKLAGFAGKGKN